MIRTSRKQGVFVQIADRVSCVCVEHVMTIGEWSGEGGFGMGKSGDRTGGEGVDT